MSRRRKPKPHKRKSPEELARQYAEEAELRTQLDSLFFRACEFSRSLEAQDPLRILVQRYVERRGTLEPLLTDFLNALGEVVSVNIRLQRQIEDLETRLGVVHAAITAGRPLPADSVQQPTVPAEMREAAAINVMLEMDAANRRSELRVRWPTAMIVPRGRESLARLVAFVDELSLLLDNVAAAS